MPGTATSAALDTADLNGSLVWEVDVFGKDHENHDVTVNAASPPLSGGRGPFVRSGARARGRGRGR